MALLFMEGWDFYQSPTFSGATTWGRWDNALANLASGSPRFGSQSGRFWQDNSRANFWSRFIGSNLDSGVLGVAFNPGSSLSGNPYASNIFVLYEGSLTTVQMGLRINNDRTLSIYRQTDSTVLGTSTATVQANDWSYIELKWKISNSISTNDVIAYINGVNVLSLAATTDTQATGNAYATAYGISGTQPAVTNAGDSTMSWDDHYFLDLTGAANNGPLGDVRVVVLRPNGNGNSSQFVGSDANSVNNYQLVADPSGPPDDDSSYVESSGVGNKDTYAFEDLPTTTNTVFGVQCNLFAKKTDTDTRTINTVVRIGSTDYDLAATGNITSTLTDYRTIAETKPSDSTQWTVSDVNAAEFGIKVNS